MDTIRLISGRSNPKLVNGIKHIIDITRYNNGVGKATVIPSGITDFANGEIFVKYNESIRGKHVFIVQSLTNDPNKDLVELLMMIHTAKYTSANKITVIVPTIYGSRQDRKTKPRTPLTIKLVFDLIEKAGANDIMTVSLHSPQSTAASNIPITNLSTAKIFLKDLNYNQEHDNFKYVIVSPDVGGIPKAKHYAKMLNADFAYAEKERNKNNEAIIANFTGEVENRCCLIIDDMIDTGGSLWVLVKELIKRGATFADVLATHLYLSKKEKFISNYTKHKEFVRKIYGTDSIYHNNYEDFFAIKSIDVLLADAIMGSFYSYSVGDLYEDEELS